MPANIYKERLAARRQAAARCQSRHIRIGNARLVVALIWVAVAWAALGNRVISPWYLLPPAAVFIALVVWHETVVRARERADRAVAYYNRGIARLEDRWAGGGEPGERFRSLDHPYAEDLDLFGKGGLFELLSTARTLRGEEILADWLMKPTAIGAARARQTAVEELRERLDLREDLAVLGQDVRTGVHSEALLAWAEAAPLLPDGASRIAAVALTVIALAGAVAWALTDSVSLIAVPLVGVAAFSVRLRRRVLEVIARVEQAAHDLTLLSESLERMEREQFESPRLKQLRAELDADGDPPSRRIARLNRLVELIDSRDNVLMRIIGPPLLYTTHLAFAVEAWRRNSGSRARRWVDALGEMEALGSLAGYAYEHPADPFPELADGEPSYSGQALGHPLLPEARAVRNDVRLGGELHVLVVSGSNMSGKSTLLRTVGVNAVLAMAGAPVRARSLRLTPFQVGASIRINDSLQGGSSRFYAEITRLRLLLDLAGGPMPLLFLLDELLHGTNSHDRRIGAQGVVNGLLARDAIGMLTTHDLALTGIVEEIGERGANVHFEDHLEDGKMIFDYRMRPGVVQKSNALELMRSVGLQV